MWVAPKVHDGLPSAQWRMLLMGNPGTLPGRPCPLSPPNRPPEAEVLALQSCRTLKPAETEDVMTLSFKRRTINRDP